MATNTDVTLSRTRVAPIPTAKSTRFQDVRNLTSMPAGRMVPLVAIPMLRMDAVRRCSLRLSFEMNETTEILMNGVFVSVKAYLVSNLAFDRFDGMDALNRSYQGIAVEGLPVVPFYETATADAPGTNLIYKYLGMQYKLGDTINTHYVEAYNQIWNFRARNRSQDLTQRTRLDATLAPAFWRHQQFKNVVPSFDQAVIDGEVPLNVVDSNLPVKGIGMRSTGTFVLDATHNSIRETGGGTVAYSASRAGTATGNNELIFRGNAAGSAVPAIFAELAEGGITVSLSNIEVARKTQAFARLKEQYQGLTDEYIIDLLMSGISVPEQAMNQPILLGEQTTIFGMSKRYATDSPNLTESVANGATFMDLTFRTPEINAGGIVMVVAECLPEQLFERQRDPFMYLTGVSQHPDYLRDELDPEKVEIVLNGQVDAAHATGAGTFGYAPLNWKWMVQQPRIGGRFYRSDPTSTTNDEDRQRLWAVETINPSLAADFYIATNINTKPFVVTNQDPFECVTRGMCLIEGNTVFGGALVESTGSYDEIMAKVPMERLPTSTSMETDPLDEVSEKLPANQPASKPKVKARPAK